MKSLRVRKAILLFKLTILCVFIFTGNILAFSGDGLGTEAAPYVITNVFQLQEMVDDLDASYILGNDIDAADTVNWNGGAGFEPVGQAGNDSNFIGAFDGKGFTISNLFINRPENVMTQYIGLFGMANAPSDIKNVVLLNFNITGYYMVGALVGRNTGSIEDCYVEGGSVSGSYARIGGLVGHSHRPTAFINKCGTNVTVNGGEMAGGLAGAQRFGSKIYDSYALGNVNGTSKCGGLVGDNCDGDDGTLVKRCYSVGFVSGSGGGLIGYNWDGGLTEDSYWDIETSGKTSSRGGMPKTTAEMMQEVTFTDWDFGNVWNIDEGASYPFLIAFNNVGLIAHWKLDETSGDIAYDSAGTNDGTVAGDAMWANGVIDGSLDFDGSDETVYCGNGASLNITEQITLSAWIKPTEYKWNYISGVVQKWGDASERKQYMISTKGDKVRWYISPDGREYICLTSDQFITLNCWTHLVATYDGATLKLYFNGVYDSSLSYNGSLFASNIEARIGGYGSDSEHVNNRHFKGLIDDVRIYNYALSEQEIAELYNQIPQIHTWHVATDGNDNNTGFGRESAFATIQKAIDTSVDGDTVVIWPGDYSQISNFNGKAITVTSATAESAKISAPYNYAFAFENGEGTDSVLKNLIIAEGCFGIYVNNSAPTIKNLTIANNYFGIDVWSGPEPAISNCIFYENHFGDIEGADAQFSWLIDETAPVSYWKFDANSSSIAVDSVGDNDGDLINGPVWTQGVAGGALEFDGNDDYVNCGSSTSLNLQEFTWTLWIKKAEAICVDERVLISNTGEEDFAGTYSLQIDVAGDAQDKLQFVRHGDVSTLHSNTTIEDSNWHHVVLTRKIDGASTIYLDGVADATCSIPPSTAYSKTLIGKGHSRYSNFKGIIDEVAIYDRALSEKEVEMLYKASSAGYDYLDSLMVDPDNGDYHLMSESGRYDSALGVWVLDDVTSPCVDSGNPADNPMEESMPNGGRINMGAYGGAGFASKGGQWPLQFDYNFDGVVNFPDFAAFAEHWMGSLPWVE